MAAKHAFAMLNIVAEGSIRVNHLRWGSLSREARPGLFIDASSSRQGREWRRRIFC